MGQILDILILIVCIFFSVRAFLRGFISETFSLLAFVAGFWVSRTFAPTLMESFATFGNESIIKIALYGLLFVVGYLLTKILEKQLGKFVHLILLGGLNRVLGLAFGAIEGMIIVSLVAYMLSAQTIVEIDFKSMFSESAILQTINSYINEGKGFLGI